MRRSLFCIVTGLILAGCGAAAPGPGKAVAVPAAVAAQQPPKPGFIKVAVVQMRSAHDIEENVNKIVKNLAECAGKGARVAVFPECAVTGYFKNEIPKYKEEQFLEAERRIAEACKRTGIFCVVGTPYFREGERYNMALVINDRGETIYRQAKIQLVSGDDWARPGNALSVFRIDNVVCSLIICHDSRYPELVRLPVLKGARLVFFISCESDITSEHKIIPYRAQVVARAVENGIYFVQSNTPQSFEPREGSHGQSRIIDPDGALLHEASIFGEEIVIEELDMSKAKANYGRKSLRADFLRDWWEDGMQRIGEPGK